MEMRVYFGMHRQDLLEFTEQYIIVKRSAALITYHTASARFLPLLTDINSPFAQSN